jgi:hypothetical protein
VIMKRLAVLAAGLTALAGLLGAGAAAANASVLPPARYSQYLAGYAGTQNGTKAFNDIRTAVSVPNEHNVPAGQVAVGIVLQEVSNVPGPTVGLGLVWGGSNTSSAVCDDNGQLPADQWVLEEGVVTSAAPGVPLPPSSLKPIPDAGNLFCIPADTQKYYLEIHDSTLWNQIAFVAGSAEPGDTLGYNDLHLLGPGVRFHNFGVGTDTTSGTAAGLLAAGTESSFTRVGLTQLLAPWLKAGGTNSRLTLNAENLREYIGTADGTSSGAVTLQPSLLGVGSAFTVTAIP